MRVRKNASSCVSFDHLASNFSLLVLSSSASLEGPLAVLSKFVSTHAFVFVQPSGKRGFCVPWAFHSIAGGD